MPAPPPTDTISLAEATKVWTRIGLLSFGGPAAQIALMHRELVERRRWLSERRFLHALNYCMLLPGPEAQQLAIYVGWLMHRTRGGLIAGLLFILPGFFTILGLSLLYVAYGQTEWLAALFFGIKAAILAVVVEAVIRIGRRALKTGAMIAVAAAAFIAVYVFQIPFPLIVIAAALIGLALTTAGPSFLPHHSAQDAAGDDEGFVLDRLIAHGAITHISPSHRRAVLTVATWLVIWIAPLVIAASLPGASPIYAQLGAFFSKAAMVTFGGAYAVLAYVAQEVVQAMAWLEPGEMLDGLALAESTPGPLIMVVQFVGHLAAARLDTSLPPAMAGTLGALMTVWVTFAPCFLWIFAGAPYIESLQNNRWLNAALSCITAAVVGVILNLSVWFTLHVIFARMETRTWGAAQILIPDFSTLDGAALLIAAGSMLAILKFHAGLGRTLVSAAVLGFVYKMALQ